MPFNNNRLRIVPRSVRKVNGNRTSLGVSDKVMLRSGLISVMLLETEIDLKHLSTVTQIATTDYLGKISNSATRTTLGSGCILVIVNFSEILASVHYML
jgi:hypothetical protein